VTRLLPSRYRGTKPNPTSIAPSRAGKSIPDERSSADTAPPVGFKTGLEVPGVGEYLVALALTMTEPGVGTGEFMGTS
jgi:hypothetical protein